MPANEHTATLKSRGLRPRATSVGSPGDTLRATAVGVGILWALVFVAAGPGFELQLYGDGAIFSYAIAVQDSWAFHWHNIAGRLFVYLYAVAPAEAFVGLTHDAHSGVILYGLLFFGAQSFGLAATFVADPSPRRTIFAFACASTALVLPLAFGFPTETLIAHALFWPTLAVCHRARTDAGGLALLFVLQLALVLTHAGAIIFLAAMLLSLALRDLRQAAWRTAGVSLAVIAIWLAVKAAYKPDAYIAGILYRAMLHVFDPHYVMNPMLALLGAGLAIYGLSLFILRRLLSRAHLVAAAATAGALAVYWLGYDTSLHAENRYYMRTVILMATPAFGMFAALMAFEPRAAVPRKLAGWLAGDAVIRAATGAILVVTLIQVVETAKFVSAWTDYKSAVRTLGQDAATDPSLGDARFVSTKRIDPALDRMSWWSTTHFLSVLIAPQLSPLHLVVDPRPNWFWISCGTATRNAEAAKAVPAESRHLIAIHACLHRK